MTGRRLYDHFTDALARNQHYYDAGSVLPGGGKHTQGATPEPVAWLFLCVRDRAVWNELARKIAPKSRVRS